jgi:hypothetical protein
VTYHDRHQWETDARSLLDVILRPDLPIDMRALAFERLFETIRDLLRSRR